MKLGSLLAMALGMSILTGAAQAKVTVIDDVLGRQVEVDVPAKRVVLGFYAEDYMAIGTEKAFDHVVGLSRDTWEGWRPASWNLYTNYRPSLKDIPDVGEVEAQTFSIEKVLSLKPSVVLLSDWQYKGLGMDVDRLEEAGIPIVVVDYNAQTLQRHLKSTHIIGTLTGQEKRANQIANEYQATIDATLSRIQAANLAKPRAYVEFGNKGPSQYSFTYGKNMWGAMVTMLQGDNIAAPFVEWWGPMNPEQVLASKPQVVFIAGTESGVKGDAMPMGQGIERTMAKQRLEGFTNRPGWAQMPAVENGQVYGIYQGASRTILDASMAQFIAKAMYPSLFKDVNPEQAYLDFYKKYLPVTPTGTFTVQISE
ncbi:ABC transporter substrate-binding protein [Marinomonas posidonica]|uniref:ABC-type transporter, periplasmic subunit n=1 Tax=Marinomonas posidonica (strain CECT 7376 / NCIMB 14433 / IVIA-Po-181) TaxID=491952 RepID=F6CU85_MARPP|nr:ABC transporter substrate-binding protein [Marinomonas posidonica]AEF55204.1 ABC-type transporter, periplasmic subunit [Marinomonas posidonica IVIA-Po-181]